MNRRQRRGAAITAGVAVVAGMIAYVWWSGPQSTRGHSAASPGATALRPLDLPDLSRLDPAVQQQIRQQHAGLTDVLGRAASSSAERADAFGALGKLLFASEHLREAETAFLNAQALVPGDMRWPYYLGHLYRARQEPARAIPMFERAVALAPQDVPALIWLGDLHLAGGDAAAAEAPLQRASALQPSSVAAMSRLGRAALARSDYPLAIRHLERALQLDPDAAGVHYPLGMAYRAAGDAAQAAMHLQRTSDTGGVPPSDPLMDDVARVLRGAGAFEARGMDALEARDWTSAVDNLRQAVALAPDNAVTRLNLGTALSLAGDSAAARRELLEAVRIDPALAKAHFGLGVLAQDDGRWSEAIERFTLAVRHDAGFADARFTLAEALRRTGRAGDALGHYTEVLRLNPAASQARFGYAMALVRLRRYDEARTWLTEAAQVHPDQPGFPHALARILAAAPDARTRDGRRALVLMEPLATQPSSPAVAETMAMALAEAGRFEEATEWQQRAIAAAAASGQPALAGRMEDNLARYRQRQPCRMPWRDDDPVIATVPPG